MKLLSRHSIPVWMLADSLIALTVLGGAISLLGLLPQTTNQDLLIYNSNLAEKLRITQEHAEQLREKLTIAAKDHAIEIARLQQECDVLADYRNKAKDWIALAKNQIKTLEQSSMNEKKLRQEILNLKGDFSRVVFLIDISGSMAAKSDKDMPRANWADNGEPWSFVKNQVAAWLQHLPVDSFRLVCFHHAVVQFPEARQEWLSGDTGRRQAMGFLSRLNAEGGTNTELGLQTAQSLQPTSIILFTDGAPSKPSNTGYIYDDGQVQRILQSLNQSGRNVPINVVAVNDYFNEDLGSFLHRVASATGGGFIGL